MLITIFELGGFSNDFILTLGEAFPLEKMDL